MATAYSTTEPVSTADLEETWKNKTVRGGSVVPRATPQLFCFFCAPGAWGLVGVITIKLNFVR